MFEEVTLYNCSQSSYSQQNDSQLKNQEHLLSDISLSLSKGEMVICQHSQQQCFIRLWLAPGSIKTNNKCFLYIEYQDKAGNNRYLQKSFNTQSEAICYAEKEALNETLPMH